MAEYAITLDGLEVRVGIGIHPHEAAPQRLRVSVRMTVVYPAAPSADAIDEVLDYDFVRAGVLRLAAERRYNLQETLCEAIAALCLSDARVREVRVATVKPDVYPDAAIGCEILRGRPL